MVLFWTFSASIGYSILNPMDSVILSQIMKQNYIILISVCMVFFLGVMLISPMAGFLADIKFGRYKTLRCSSYITLAVISFLSISFIVYVVIITTRIPRDPFICITLLTAGVLMTNSIVLSTNAINFGMDQLHDSSTQESIFFVHWYVWLNCLSVLVTGIPWSLFFYDTWYVDYVDAFRIVSFSLYILISGVIVFLLILSLCVVRHKQRWFLIESSGRLNPYKLVYRVVKFAWDHKIPVRRSAFTYCEDEWPSRLDLGKQKYGGPFTVEQVEDVKAFLGILKVLVSIVPIFMLQIVSQSTLPRYAMHRNFFFKPPGKILLSLMDI